jgi:hypothetical protein
MARSRFAVLMVGAFALLAVGAYEAWAAAVCNQSTSGPNKVCTTCGCKTSTCTRSTTANKCVQGNPGNTLTQYVACMPATDGEPHTCEETYNNPPLTCSIDICDCNNPQPPPNPPDPTGPCKNCTPFTTISVPNTCTSN